MKPIIQEFAGIFDPLDLYRSVAEDDISFLLESQLLGYKYNRYSIIGVKPFLSFKSKSSSIEIRQNGRTEYITGNPFSVLKNCFNRYCIVDTYLGLPTAAAAVGYFGYDLKNHIEQVPDIAKDDLELPDCYIGFYDMLLIFDSFKNKLFIVFCPLREKNLRLAEILAKESMQNIKKVLLKNITKTKKSKISAKCKISSNFTKPDYIRAVKIIKNHIARGDIYQANLSQRFSAITDRKPLEVYERLRQINPAPFASYLSFDDFKVISASPERFLRMEGDFVQTRPIKGTRRRLDGLKDDNMMKYELIQSKKDRAELIMIVDLERNDLGRVCRYSSVRVPSLMELESFPTVHHLVATVEGVLEKGKDHIDCLKACFPGGSITGAPKIMAMKIIEKLEPTKRGVYTGSIGYIGFDRRSDLNIAIRTMVIKKNNAYFQAGGGIVIDSDPQKEYDETLDKARALFEALN